MHIYKKSNTAKFHPDPIWNYRALGFFEEHCPNSKNKNNNNKMSQGAYKFGKMKFPEFSRFSRPFEQSFPDNYKAKTRCKESPWQSFWHISCTIVVEYFI